MEDMKRKVIPAAVAIAVLLSGCENIYEGEMPDYLQDVKVSFNPVVESYDGSDAEDMAQGTDAGVFMMKYGTDFSPENIVCGISNTRFVTDAEGLLNVPQGSEDILFPEAADKYDFILYSPYSGTLGEGNTISVDINSPEAENLLYSDSAKGKYKSASAVKVEFRHVLAKVTMNITNGKGISEDDLRNLKVSFNGMNSKGTLDLRSGEVSGNDTPGTLHADVSADGKTAEVLVLPTDPDAVQEKRELVFSTGDVTHSYLFDAGHIFEMGKQYVLDVTVSVPGITVEITEITDWDVETEDGVSSLGGVSQDVASL